MPDIYLQGSEMVDAASRRMESAANDMVRAANIMADACRLLTEQLEERIQLLDAVLSDRLHDLKQVQG